MDTRQKFVRAGERVRDYLDWYYITQSTEVGGDFKAYMELSDALEKESARSNNKDSIQKYLDRVQELFIKPTR